VDGDVPSFPVAEYVELPEVVVVLAAELAGAELADEMAMSSGVDAESHDVGVCADNRVALQVSGWDASKAVPMAFAPDVLVSWFLVSTSVSFFIRERRMARAGGKAWKGTSGRSPKRLTSRIPQLENHPTPSPLPVPNLNLSLLTHRFPVEIRQRQLILLPTPTEKRKRHERMAGLVP
jgi:hypothetical protein